jgi:hypothetical protein
MVGRDRSEPDWHQARRFVHNAESFRTNDHFGCAQKMKFSSLRCVASHAARTSSAIRTLRTRFLIPLNSEI